MKFKSFRLTLILIQILLKVCTSSGIRSIIRSVFDCNSTLVFIISKENSLLESSWMRLKYRNCSERLHRTTHVPLLSLWISYKNYYSFINIMNYIFLDLIVINSNHCNYLSRKSLSHFFYLNLFLNIILKYSLPLFMSVIFVKQILDCMCLLNKMMRKNWWDRMKKFFEVIKL